MSHIVHKQGAASGGDLQFAAPRHVCGRLRRLPQCLMDGSQVLRSRTPGEITVMRCSSPAVICGPGSSRVWWQEVPLLLGHPPRLPATPSFTCAMQTCSCAHLHHFFSNCMTMWWYVARPLRRQVMFAKFLCRCGQCSRSHWVDATAPVSPGPLPCLGPHYLLHEFGHE